MKFKHKILIVLVSVIVGALIGFIIYKSFNHEASNEVSTKLNKYFLEYYNDTEESEVSVEALLENGYISNTSEDKCNIYEVNEKEVFKKENDCDKAKLLAKRPIIELDTSDNFKLNEWNNKGGVIKIKLKNGGNSYYKESDIESVEWFSLDDTIHSFDNKLEINGNINTSLNVLVNFEDISYVKKVNVMVDLDAPVYKSHDFTRGFNVIYEDNYFLNNVYYYFSEEDKIPDKKDFSKDIIDTFCDRTYNVWSYAIDLAGNESKIQYLGKYVECETINSGIYSED